jgi:hypothetical protein
MRKKSQTLAYRLSMSLITKTLEHIVPAYNLPRESAVDQGKAEPVQMTAQAEVPHAALAAQLVPAILLDPLRTVARHLLSATRTDRACVSLL